MSEDMSQQEQDRFTEQDKAERIAEQNESKGSALSSAVDKMLSVAVSGGIPGTDSAKVLAESYLRENHVSRDSTDYAAKEKAVDSLIRWQCANAGSVGFVTGLGGLMTLPLTLPTDVAGSLFL